MKRVALGICFLSAAAYASTALTPYVRETFAAIEREHAARPALVHFWSVSCAPCLAEMPRLAEMRKRRADVDFVFVNTDAKGDRAKIRARLEAFGLDGAVNFVFADDFVERLYFEVDPSWRGELPFSVLVKRGAVANRAMGTLDENDFGAWLRNDESGH